MAYRRPGVTVTQEFVGLVPALASFALPSITVGPAYQLVDGDYLGVYAAEETLFDYASKIGGGIVDLEALASDEQFPITKKPLEVTLKLAKVEILAEQATGAAVGDVFTDVTSDQFADVQAGDIVTIVEQTDVDLVSVYIGYGIEPRTDGETTTTNKDRLYAGSGNPLLFAHVKAGDTVVVSGGTNTNVGTYTVVAVIGTDRLILNSDVNSGAAASTNVEYLITGTRGTINAGDYVVKTKTDSNTLVLKSPLADSPEAPLTYSIKRAVGDIVLDRVATVSGNGFVASEDGVTLPAILTYNARNVVYGKIYATYRALRVDLAAEVWQFTDVASLNAIFGVGQTLPANPLAYGVSIMMQNTVTPVHGLGLDANAVANEVLSYTQATDVLKRGFMYAIALLTQNPVVHTLYKNHVEQLSMPLKKAERIVIINSKLVDTLVLQEEATTVVTPNGARSVVGMQVDGAGSFSVNPKKLTDPTTGQFTDKVKAGDTLVVISGTGATPGIYTVGSVVDGENLLTTTNFLASGTPTDIQYYIYRHDGLAAGGASFYDRHATFLSSGVASGHYLNILAGSFKGRYKIATVVSEKELTLLPVISSAVTLATGITYQVDRDLQKYEQADAVKGYSEAFSSRRVTHIWPDVLRAPVGQQVYSLPGYYACCAIAGLTTGLPTQQGLTNLAISGFLGFEHSTRYFTEDELDTIADGGTMILAQDGADQPLYVRHQLTTDRSAIKFQEYSITKNVDFIAKFMRNTFSVFVGQYNIVDTTLDVLKMTAGAAVKFLLEKTRVPKFGGVIRSGGLSSLVESPDQIDTVLIRFSFGIPIPLNNIDITIEV